MKLRGQRQNERCDDSVESLRVAKLRDTVAATRGLGSCTSENILLSADELRGFESCSESGFGLLEAATSGGVIKKREAT